MSFSSFCSSTAFFLSPPRTNGCDCDPGGAECENAVSDLSKDRIKVRGDFEEVSHIDGLDGNIMFDGIYSTEVHTRLCDIVLRLAEDLARKFPSSRLGPKAAPSCGLANGGLTPCRSGLS